MSAEEILAGKRAHLELRCRILQTIRRYFIEDGFMEVQTPLRTPAPAPELYIEAIPADAPYFLITSPELYMKRLLAAGYERVFQISPVFRRGEHGRFHHSEFTMLEWYRLHADYRTLQEDCRNLLLTVCHEEAKAAGWDYQGHWLQVEGAWQHYTVREAFRRFAGWEPSSHVDQYRFDRDLVEKVEPHLGFPTPCILSDYPSSQAALARLRHDDPSVAERFELYWAGLELANGFSELTDAAEQRSRFHEALLMRRQQGYAPYPLPERFLASLEHLQPCAGIALGVDRLIMLLGNAGHIDEIVPFPPGFD